MSGRQAKSSLTKQRAFSPENRAIDDFVKTKIAEMKKL